MKSIIIGLYWAAFLSSALASLPEAKVTILVLDDGGKPIPEAHVGIGFESPGRVDTIGIPVEGITDQEGKFSASQEASGYLGFIADKEGYYGSDGTPQRFEESQDGKRWEPWNPTLTIVLKKIVHPVAMFARKAELRIPILGQPLGFDLKEGDWVAPYGKGRQSDFIFEVKRSVKDHLNYLMELVLTFPGKHDGIQPVSAPAVYGSLFKLPREAPEEGYLSSWKITEKSSSEKGIETFRQPDRSFIYRVSSGGNGGDDRKLYGKILGDITLSGALAEKPTLYFQYYLNPDGTRNLEFDSQHNLFQKLTSLEQVNSP